MVPCTNLTKYVQGPHEKNKTLLSEIKEELSEWRGIPCSWIGRLETQHKPNQDPSKLRVDVDYPMLTFRWRGDTGPEPPRILTGKNKVRGLALPDLKRPWEATVFKTVWCW